MNVSGTPPLGSAAERPGRECPPRSYASIELAIGPMTRSPDLWIAYQLKQEPLEADEYNDRRKWHKKSTNKLLNERILEWLLSNEMWSKNGKDGKSQVSQKKP